MNYEDELPSLFASDDSDEDELPDVAWVQVYRYEAGGKLAAPRMFSIDEVPSAEVLFERFGGGSYEVVGRNQSKSRIVARRSIKLAGPPRPLHMLSQPEPEPVPVVAAQSAAISVAGGADSLIALVLSQQARSAETQTQFMAAMLKSMADNNTAMVSAMMASQAENTRALVQLMAQAQTGGRSDPAEAFLRGAEIVSAMKQGAEEKPEEDEENTTLETIAQGLKVFTAATGQPAAGGGES